MKSLIARISNRRLGLGAIGRPARELDELPVGDRGHAVDAELQLARPVEPAIDLGLVAGETPASWTPVRPACEDEFLRRQDLPGESASTSAGNVAPTRPMAPSMKTPVGSPVGVAEDLAVGRGLRLAGDLAPAHRLGVGPAGVTVDAEEPDRAIRRDRVEDVGRREGAARPEALVPVPAR